MRFAVDECLFRFLVDALRNRGHDVVWVKETSPGLDDPSVLEVATADNRIVVTEDRDFGTLTVLQHQPAVGVVILAVSEFDPDMRTIAEHAATVMTELGDDLAGNLTVIQPKRIRQRKLDPLH